MPSCHDRVAVLDSSNRVDRIGVAQILFVCLRDAPGTDLAFLHEIGHGGSDRLRLDLGIDAVLAAEIDMVGLKAPDASLSRLPDGRRRRIHYRRAVGSMPDAELRGDDHAVTDRRKRCSHDILVVGLRAIGTQPDIALGRIEERIAHLIGFAHDTLSLGIRHQVSACVRESHAVHAQRRYLDATLSQYPPLHLCALPGPGAEVPSGIPAAPLQGCRDPLPDDFSARARGQDPAC